MPELQAFSCRVTPVTQWPEFRSYKPAVAGSSPARRIAEMVRAENECHAVRSEVEHSVDNGEVEGPNPSQHIAGESNAGLRIGSSIG